VRRKLSFGLWPTHRDFAGSAESRLLVDVGRAARRHLRRTSGPILRQPPGRRAPRLRA